MIQKVQKKVLPLLLLLKTNHWVCVFDYMIKGKDTFDYLSRIKGDFLKMILQIDLCRREAVAGAIGIIIKSPSDEQHLIIGRDLQLSC